MAKHIVAKKIKILRLIFAFFFHFSFFSISHSNVIHREICVKDFSGITAPRILKFGANVGYVLLHCVRENQPPDAYRFLYLSIFLSLPIKFSDADFSASMRVFKFLIHLESGQVYCGTENQDDEIYFIIFFYFFSFFPSLTPI